LSTRFSPYILILFACLNESIRSPCLTFFLDYGNFSVFGMTITCYAMACQPAVNSLFLFTCILKFSACIHFLNIWYALWCIMCLPWALVYELERSNLFHTSLMLKKVKNYKFFTLLHSSLSSPFAGNKIDIYLSIH
jgi:hypothetical protein